MPLDIGDDFVNDMIGMTSQIRGIDILAAAEIRIEIWANHHTGFQCAVIHKPLEAIRQAFLERLPVHKLAPSACPRSKAIKHRKMACRRLNSCAGKEYCNRAY